ncbi:hypothetical protein L3Q82_021881 [Scortum barcoo]|uniref:Uncharacterized protein n=1 Tax=Scortum barcoo TaxID=214431 RepID=A0ACB8X550_9TELE|nr:hypothetical protein L3Q82_021881 [Scortum barcoo]
MASWIITVMVLSVFISSGQGKRDKVLYCSAATCLIAFTEVYLCFPACKAIVDELNYSISQVDPKKTINVGSFRLNPDGTVKDKKPTSFLLSTTVLSSSRDPLLNESEVRKVPFARSETHLSELLDGVCNSMSDYSLYVDPDTQHKQYMRFAPRNGVTTGDFPDLKNFQFDGPEASSALKFAPKSCETVVEELEDDIISVFSQDVEHVHEELCNRVSGLKVPTALCCTPVGGVSLISCMPFTLLVNNTIIAGEIEKTSVHRSAGAGPEEQVFRM